jgi:hypothetical protein
MGENNIAHAILSDALAEAIGERKVKLAVFLTFEFDPSFFEEDILPNLFDQSFSHIPTLKLVSLEEALRHTQDVAVYYDRRGLSDHGTARLDYRRIPLSRSTGYFHPKNIFLLLENEEDDDKWESLLVVTSSANLTRNGWWRNLEVADIQEVVYGEKSTLRSELLELISRVKAEDPTGDEHQALEAIRTFLRKDTEEPSRGKKHGRWLPQLYVGRESVPDFIGWFCKGEQLNLEIISPYFDVSPNSSTLKNLIEAMDPKEVRLFLPEEADGSVACSKEYFVAIQKMPRVKWGRLPEELLRTSTQANSKSERRFVHAKIYRLWNQEREILFIGSVNLTSPAHQLGRSGNFETGILVEPERSGRLTWWLTPIDEKTAPRFQPKDFEEADQKEFWEDCSIRYHWDSGKLEYFWDSEGSIKPKRAFVKSKGVTLFAIGPIRFDRWIDLDSEAASQMKTLLVSTSIVEVSVERHAEFRVLVREEGMALKPSILFSLTAEQILEYWSLLSPEQRESFLIAHIPQLGSKEFMGLVSGKQQQMETMFDKFAGIYHAFNRLEASVRDALQKGREADAEYRLLGEKYHSLPSLIRKVLDEPESDAVNQYVTLLCAKEVTKRIAMEFPDFQRKNRLRWKEVEGLLIRSEEIKTRFTFETPEERAKFLEWFERMFFLEVALPEADEDEE